MLASRYEASRCAAPREIIGTSESPSSLTSREPVFAK